MILGMARTKRVNRYCMDCGGRLVYYPHLSNPKAPNEYRILTYACPDCTDDFDKPKMFTVARNVEDDTLESVRVEIHQVRKQLERSTKINNHKEKQIAESITDGTG